MISPSPLRVLCVLLRLSRFPRAFPKSSTHTSASTPVRERDARTSDLFPAGQGQQTQMKRPGFRILPRLLAPTFNPDGIVIIQPSVATHGRSGSDGATLGW